MYQDPIRLAPSHLPCKLIFHVHVCTCIIMCLFTVISGKREMTIVDCAMMTDAVKWNERVLLLQTLGLLK